ncbi:MAG: hypothetical protein AAB449_00265 [Patescibacteria group bacterium]
MADPLEKLLGSSARIKLLRLFLFNPKQFFTIPQAASRARVTERTVRKELKLFHGIRLVRRSSTRKRSGARYGLNDDFKYLAALQNLLLNASSRGEYIYDYVRKAGSIKLIVLSGIFLGDWDGALDLLIVGDRVQDHKLRTLIRRFESDLGKELRYACLASDDFFYRLNMNDKLVRDVLDYPHRIVFDKLNIGLK